MKSTRVYQVGYKQTIRKISGFALPTVLISSVVMLTVLAVTVTAASTIRTSLKTQFYSQLARAAGDAGVAYAKACLAANGNVPTWSNANPLTPQTNCSGTIVAGYPTAVASFDDVRSSYSVGMPTTDANGRAVTIPNSGYVQLLRTSTGAVWKTYTQPTAQAAVVPDLCSGSATSTLGWSNAVMSASPGAYTISGSGAKAIEASSSNVYPGMLYFRKDFSVTKDGTYQLSIKAGNGFVATIDGDEVASAGGGGSTTTTGTQSLTAGCHTLAVAITVGGISPAQIRLVASLRQSGSSNEVVMTDTSWRTETGDAVSFSDPQYYMSPAWGVVRDLNAVTATNGSWATTSGDSYARYISTTHSYSGANYPAAQYAYFRDYRDVDVSSSTPAILTVLCDDQCDVFMDGSTTPILTSIGSTNLTSQGITLTEGSHRFAVRLYNSAASASAFALAVVRSSDNGVLTRTDARWQAADAWTASPQMYYSYDKAFTPNPDQPRPGFMDVLVVAGGGGGGGNCNSCGGPGGGGAGGVVYDSQYKISSPTSISVTVGAGGAGGTGTNAVGGNGANGANSVFGTLTAIGGGGGRPQSGATGGAGGSGGGGSGGGSPAPGAGGAGTAGQGYAGTGGGSGTGTPGGGGGGAMAAAPAGSHGGAGLGLTITGTLVNYAGGGAAGAYGNYTPGTGGIGGGGNGVNNTMNGGVGYPGAANTGGGGGGGNGYNLGGAGGAGGSGVVIISYPTGSMTATGGTITYSGGKTIHRFTSSGTFTVTSINN